MAGLEAVSAVLEVNKFLVTVCERLQKLAEDNKSAPGELKKLRDKVEDHAAQMERLGTTVVPKSILESFAKSATDLTVLEEKIRAKGRTGWLIAWRLDPIITNVNKGMDDFIKWLERVRDVDLLVHRQIRELPAHQIIGNEHLFVRFGSSESKLNAALEDDTGPSIILLHGGVGTGKSTLARYVLYRQQEHRTFDGRVIVQCQRADCTKIQREILRTVAPNDQKDVPDADIEKVFHNVLRYKKTLVVLDHVSDPLFLLRMANVPSGCKYKYLVTSQESDLCRGIKQPPKRIEMGKPTKDEARRILFTLLDLKEQKISSSDVKGLADSIIGDLGRNPLALGCLAEGMASKFRASKSIADLQVWEEVKKTSLREFLRQPEQGVVLFYNANGDRAESVWEAMKRCFESLKTKDEAEYILFLIYLSKGASLPEEVLQILYERVTGGKRNFEQAREELRMRELLSSARGLYASSESIPDNQKQPRKQHYRSKAWSLPPLVKLYMKERVKTKKTLFESMIATLVGDRKAAMEDSLYENQTLLPSASEDKANIEEARVTAIALCALYFDQAHPDQLPGVISAIKRVCSALETNSARTSEVVNKREAVEPIIWLMRHQFEKHEKLTESDLDHARKLFLKYICESRLGNGDFSALLKVPNNPQAQLAVLKALQSVFKIDSSIPLLSSNHQNLLDALKAFLSIKGDSDRKDAASEVLVRIVKRQIKFLDQGENSEWQENGGWTLKTVASTRSTWMKGKVADGALKTLVKVLNDDRPTSTRIQAAEALKNLADTGNENSIRKTIVRKDNAVAGLVTCLLQQIDLKLQVEAASALENLALGNDAIKRQLVYKDDRLLPGLGKLLYETFHRDRLRRRVALTLWHLASSQEDEVKGKIVNAKDVIPGLVKTLSERQKPDLRQVAAKAVKSLAGTADKKDKRLLKSDELLEGLRKAKDPSHTDLWKHAEQALKLLGQPHRE